jgi:hypothetical protein
MADATGIDWFGETTGINKIAVDNATPSGTAPQAATSDDARSIDWFGDTTGINKIGASPAPSAASAGTAPKQSWGDWIEDKVIGKHDPAYAGVGSVYAQFPRELENPMGMAATLGASDPQMGDIVAKSLGPMLVRREKDANGYDVFVTRGPDGKEQRGYLNQPGLDREDVVRTVRGSLPYVAGGEAAAGLKAGSLGLKALGAAAAGGTTSIAGDLAMQPMGSNQGVDIPKAAITASVGAVAPLASAAIGALWRNFVTIPGLIDRTTGQLTQKGLDAALKAGIDTSSLTPDVAKSFAKAFAESGDEAAAATRSSLDQYGIPATRGQVTKDPFLLTQEEGMRRKLYGESAQSTMLGFDQQQKDAVRFAALGSDGPPGTGGSGTFAPRQGIGEQINPTRRPGASEYDRMPSTLGGNVQDALQTARQNARTQESALWDDSVTKLAPMPEALQMLPEAINPRIADIPIDTANTPIAASMRDQLTKFMKGEAPETVDSPFKSAPVKTVDQMRRRLLAASSGADNGQDKAAANALYDGFNDWITKASDAKLLAGDPAGAMNLAKARGFTKEVRQIFEPKTADGRLSSAAQRIAKALDDAKADSGEGVIQSLLGSEGTRGVNQSTVSALQNVKTALDRFAPADQASQAWNDIRLAYWSRLVTNKGGEMLGPTAMLGNIKSAVHGQQSLMTTLFSPVELREMRKFTSALEQIAYKPPNASGSGYTAASFMKEGLAKLLDTFRVGTLGRAIVEKTGIGHAWNAAQAKQAIRQLPTPVSANLSPAIMSGGAAYARGQFYEPANPVLNALAGPRQGNALAGRR